MHFNHITAVPSLPFISEVKVPKVVVIVYRKLSVYNGYTLRNYEEKIITVPRTYNVQQNLV